MLRRTGLLPRDHVATGATRGKRQTQDNAGGRRASVRTWFAGHGPVPVEPKPTVMLSPTNTMDLVAGGVATGVPSVSMPVNLRPGPAHVFSKAGSSVLVSLTTLVPDRPAGCRGWGWLARRCADSLRVRCSPQFYCVIGLVHRLCL